MVALPSRAPLLRALLATLLLGAAVPANAQEHPSFDAAMKLMRDGMFSEACPKLEEALAASKTMIVRFRLAECYEQTGKLASALLAFREVAGEAALTNLPDREAFATKKALELEPRVPKLKLLVPPEIGANSELEITIDDKVLARDAWADVALLDLGSHKVTVSGVGYRTWSFEFELKSEREIRTIQVPNQSVAQPTPPPHAPAKPPIETPDGDASGMSIQAIAGMTVGAVGLALIGIGIGGGVSAKAKYDDSLVGCNPQNQCTSDAIALQEEAVASGNIATAIFVIGAAATVGGAALWILAPSADDVALGITPGGLQLRASF